MGRLAAKAVQVSVRVGLGVLGSFVFAGAGLGEIDVAEVVGAWRGAGEIAVSDHAVTQRGRCNVEVRAGTSGRDLVIEGLCAASAGRSEFSLAMIVDDGDRVRATLMSDRLSAAAGFAGQLSGERIEVQSVSLFSVDDVLYSSRFDIDFRDADSFVLQQWMRPESGGPEHRTLLMRFERR